MGRLAQRIRSWLQRRQLIRSLQNKDWHLRMRAVQCLSEHGGAHALSALVTAVDSRISRRWAAQELARGADPRDLLREVGASISMTASHEVYVLKLENVCESQDRSVRLAAARALAALGQSGLTALSTAYDALDDPAKTAVAIALGEVGDRRGLELLIHDLAKGDDAVTALSRIGRHAVEPLVETLGGKGCYYHWQGDVETAMFRAIDVLRRVSDPRAVNRLLFLSRGPRFAESCVGALTHILRESAQTVAQEDLTVLESFGGIQQSRIREDYDPLGDKWFLQRESLSVDCSQLHELARLELNRRAGKTAGQGSSG